MADTQTPWNPVPESANRYFVLGVLSLDIRVRQDGPEIATMVVFAPIVPDALGYHGLNGWRITFGTVRGYRMPLLSESRLSIRDFLPATPDWAMWEVAPSSWPPQSARYPLRHFVVADEDSSFR